MNINNTKANININNNTQENIENNPKISDILEGYVELGLDDTFKFNCTQCGRCCKHRENILLSPKDLFNIAKELGLTIQETVEKYCEAYLGPDSRIPVVRILPRGNVQRCPFLSGGKCSVHKAKPTMCAAFPIGRVMKFPYSDKANIEYTPEVLYVYSDPGCGDNTETYTVREWLRMFNIPEDDEYFILWSTLTRKITIVIRALEEKHVSKNLLSMLVEYIYLTIYCNYDMEEETVTFLEQFKQNENKIISILDKIIEEEKL